MKPRIQDAFLPFARNARWGTCGVCPRDSNGHAYPEFCVETQRSDHQLGVDELARAHKAHGTDGGV